MEAREVLTSLGCEKHDYIGDGVYCGWDGFQVWLVTLRDGIWHKIALDDRTAASLFRYLGNVAAQQEGG